VTGTIRRRLIALAAAYAIALQAVVASFTVVSAVGAVPGLCTSGAPQTPGPDPGHAQPCIACPAFCGDGGPPGVAAAGVSTVARRAAAVRVEHGMRRLAERSAPRNLPPSRAPPAA
jgi:hypothetical protein